MAPSAAGAAHSYQLDQLLTALPQRLPHTSDGLHRFPASGEGRGGSRGPHTLVHHAVSGDFGGGAGIDLVQKYRKAALSDGGDSLARPRPGAEVVPMAMVAVLVQTAWRWVRSMQHALLAFCRARNLLPRGPWDRQVRRSWVLGAACPCHPASIA